MHVLAEKTVAFDLGIGKNEKNFFVTCLNQTCTEIFVQLDMESEAVELEVSNTVMFLPVTNLNTTRVEKYYNQVCKLKGIRDEKSESCKNLNFSLPYFYVHLEGGKHLSNNHTIGQLKISNIDTIQEGGK